MSIKLNSVGGGSVTIQEPNTASDFTLSVPAITANLLTNRTAGAVLQVVSVTKTDAFSTTSGSFVDVTGLTATITPSNSNNRILVIVSVNAGANPAGVACFKLQRNNADIVIGDAAGSRVRTTFTYYAGSGDNPSAGVGTNFLDSPSTTSATTYKIVINSNTSGQTVGVNRTMTDSDVSSSQRNTSTITLMEIAA